MGVASTVWPIAFAAVIGALVRAVALFKAERGTSLGVSSFIRLDPVVFSHLLTDLRLSRFFWAAKPSQTLSRAHSLSGLFLPGPFS